MCACVEQKREKKPSRALNVSNARSLNYDVNATAADNDIDLKMYSAQKKSSAQSLRRSRGNFDIQQKGEVRGRRRARIAGGYVGARERALGFRRFVARKRRNLQHEKGLYYKPPGALQTKITIFLEYLSTRVDSSAFASRTIHRFRSQRSVMHRSSAYTNDHNRRVLDCGLQFHLRTLECHRVITSV